MKVAKGSQELSGRALERSIIAENCSEHATEFDRLAAEAEFDEYLRQYAA